jgi:phosphate transport system substrate-binding protein
MPVKETFEEESGGVILDIVRSRSGVELYQLMRGEVAAVVSVHTLEDLLRAAAAEQVPVDTSLLQIVEVGTNDTVVLLNRHNAIKKLTRKQLKGILAGRITNWRQLNGANRGIVVVLNVAPTADNNSFIREILGEEKFAPKLHTAYSYEDVRKLITDTPGAIGFTPSGYAAASISVPRSPKVSTPVIVVTRGTPSRQVSILTEILKDMALLQ